MAHLTTRRSGSRALTFVLALGAPMAVVASCGSGTNGTHGSACLGSNAPANCSSSCANDVQCGTGLYCFSGRCTGDCVPDNGAAGGCANGAHCSANGRCIAATTGDGGTNTGGDGGTNTTDPDGSSCPSVDVSLAREQATLMLLIDQSGSMTEHFGNTTRWRAIRSTLIDPTNGVVRQLQSEIHFGLAMYTSHNGTSGGACPILRPPLNAVLNNYQAIADAMNAAEPDDDTPTAESVTAAARLLMNVAPDDDPGQRAIVLATDGEPDTCADPDAQDNGPRQAAARAGSVAAVQAAFSTGIRTYVISVGSEVSAMHLQDLANAGAGMSGAHYYQALDPAALTSAFDAITHAVRSCTFSLHGSVDATQAGSGDVELDGMRLMYNGADGWRLASPSTIELTGAACDRARTTGSSLTAHFPCGVVTPG